MNAFKKPNASMHCPTRRVIKKPKLEQRAAICIINWQDSAVQWLLNMFVIQSGGWQRIAE